MQITFNVNNLTRLGFLRLKCVFKVITGGLNLGFSLLCFRTNFIQFSKL